MSRTNFEDLLEAGVHFGHLKRKWHPAMAPYIFGEKKGIHVIDLNKTVAQLEESAAALKQIAKSGKRILFVATKKQAKEVVSKLVKETGMPYVTERWSGGMLTNFQTVRRAVKKMSSIDKMATDGTFENMSKRERLQVSRQREKLEKTLGSISEMSRLPAAVFIVDIKKEHIALKEAKRLNIPVFAMVDTNSNPSDVDFVIPANDDATKSIEKVVGIVCAAVKEGLEDRKSMKETKEEEPKAEKEETKKPAKKVKDEDTTEEVTSEAKEEA